MPERWFPAPMQNLWLERRRQPISEARRGAARLQNQFNHACHDEPENVQSHRPYPPRAPQAGRHLRLQPDLHKPTRSTSHCLAAISACPLDRLARPARGWCASRGHNTSCSLARQPVIASPTPPGSALGALICLGRSGYRSRMSQLSSRTRLVTSSNPGKWFNLLSSSTPHPRSPVRVAFRTSGRTHTRSPSSESEPQSSKPPDRPFIHLPCDCLCYSLCI